MYSLGHKQKFDARDEKYLARMMTSSTEATEKMWFDDGWWGNQQNHPFCVGFSWRHWLMDGPTRQKSSCIWATRIYKQAQLVDEWPGVSYAGTSVRAGAKVLKKRGYISEYRWAVNTDMVTNSLLHMGPVVVGTNWHSSMYEPDKHGLIRISGRGDGGHAYILNGVDLERGVYRIKNSWGRKWGLDGRAFIRINDFGKLLSNGGVACVATEIERA